MHADALGDLPRIQTSTIYLGERAKRKEREAKLDQIAAALGLKNRSVLIQKIADGELVVKPEGDEVER